ncbi:hypothetical protein BH09ACT1_BH09ACT1_27180 [soil metagenome]
MRICSNCGAQLGSEWKFCTRCGTPVAAELAQQFPPPVAAYLRLEIVQPRDRRGIDWTVVTTVGITIVGIAVILCVILLLLAPHD